MLRFDSRDSLDQIGFDTESIAQEVSFGLASDLAHALADSPFPEQSEKRVCISKTRSRENYIGIAARRAAGDEPLGMFDSGTPERAIQRSNSSSSLGGLPRRRIGRKKAMSFRTADTSQPFFGDESRGSMLSMQQTSSIGSIGANSMGSTSSMPSIYNRLNGLSRDFEEEAVVLPANNGNNNPLLAPNNQLPSNIMAFPNQGPAGPAGAQPQSRDLEIDAETAACIRNMHKCTKRNRLRYLEKARALGFKFKGHPTMEFIKAHPVISRNKARVKELAKRNDRNAMQYLYLEGLQFRTPQQKKQMAALKKQLHLGNGHSYCRYCKVNYDSISRTDYFCEVCGPDFHVCRNNNLCQVAHAFDAKHDGYFTKPI